MNIALTPRVLEALRQAAPEKSIAMQSEELLVVAESVRVEADGVISIELVARDGAELPAWAPGAHIVLSIDGALERHYSLCGDPLDTRRWRIAVLLEPESRGGSQWLHSSLKAGDLLQVRGPHNHFPLEIADTYVLVAGGIGITPLLPMMQELDRRGADWRLMYGGRSRASMAFLRELERYGERVHVRPQDEFGLLDLPSWIGAAGAGTQVYTCGPGRLLDAVEAQCADWPEGALHLERFQPSADALEGPRKTFEVVLQRTGKSCMVGADEPLIDAIERLGVHVPRSCGEGTCGTCATRVLEGLPDHRDSFLMGKKRAANKTICVCCSRSLTPQLVLDL